MILHIDWRSWRELPLSHRTRHVYLNLIILTTAVPDRPLDSFRKKLKLRTGQWHQTKGELRHAGLIKDNRRLVIHSSVMLTRSQQQQLKTTSPQSKAEAVR